MKIVILDGATLNPGDLSWEGFEALGEVTVYDKTEEADILNRSIEAEILITNKTPLNKSVLEKLPKLKYIGALATGYDVVDIEYARERNIPVTNVPGYGSDAVAQQVFAFILDFANKIRIHDASVRQGQWQEKGDFSYFLEPLMELSGKTIGIVGLGQIGQRVAEIALAFNMQVLAYNRSKKDTFKNSTNFKWVPLEDLYKGSDFITLHLPLSKDTEGMINLSAINKMKPEAIIINTARGKLIHEEALAEALNELKIAGAALDVLSSEPPSEENPLLKAKNCNITPHIAWAAKEARGRLMDIAVNNLKGYINGKIINCVNE